MTQINSISIVIPFFNEKENVSLLIEKLNFFVNEVKPIVIEVVFVDDGSTDNSSEILLSSKDVKFVSKIIKLSKNSGSHAAIRAGISQSSSSFVTVMAADLQDPLSLIKDLNKECLLGADIAFGQRRSVNERFFVRLFSKLNAIFMRKFAIKNYPSKGVDIVMFNAKVAKVLNNNIESNSNFIIQLLSFGFKQSFVEYDKDERKYGASKWTFPKRLKLLIDSFVAFSYTPIRFVSVTGLVFFVFGIIWTFYIVWRKITMNDLVAGWPALTSILLLGFGITNISLGIIAEYLWRTLDSSRKRPVFIIDEIIELNKHE